MVHIGLRSLRKPVLIILADPSFLSRFLPLGTERFGTCVKLSFASSCRSTNPNCQCELWILGFCLEDQILRQPLQILEGKPLVEEVYL